MRSIHYYVQGLLDLEDVIRTINAIIEKNIPPFERTNTKKQCSVSSMPLKDQLSGMILKVNLPDNIFSNKDLKKQNPKTRELKETGQISLPVPVKKKGE